MNATTQDKKDMEKVTIYVKSELLGNIVAIEARLVEFGRRRYAQYENAPFVKFICKGARKLSGVQGGTSRTSSWFAAGIVPLLRVPSPLRLTMVTAWRFLTHSIAALTRAGPRISRLNASSRPKTSSRIFATRLNGSGNHPTQFVGRGYEVLIGS